jgi:tricarballylate dehydrogenase
VLNQPGQFAWQIFDQKVASLLRDEYRIKQVTTVKADTLEELVGKLEGVDAAAALEEIRAYNAAIKKEIAFNPNVKDGRGTTGLQINKTNWANTIEDGPFQAFQVGCGVTFTFGGLRVNDSAQVLDVDLVPIEGLFAAGELVGGLFYFNYPGGTGLMAGTVFGRLAGGSAAASAKAA